MDASRRLACTMRSFDGTAEQLQALLTPHSDLRRSGPALDVALILAEHSAE